MAVAVTIVAVINVHLLIVSLFSFVLQVVEMDFDKSVDTAAMHLLKGKQGDILRLPWCHVS